MNTPQAFFGQMVERVAGQAFAAAGYTLQNNPMHQSRGLYRYAKALPSGLAAYVEFQLLYYQGSGPSRFRVNLLRNAGPDARANVKDSDKDSEKSEDSAKVEITLTKLIWDEFGVRQLDSDDHWWLFSDPNQLGHAVAEAGKLLFGFGIPWLEGTLTPDDDDTIT
ncbi:MAG: hypothetical protein ABI947_20280 [Chloroflexota bacterium]